MSKQRSINYQRIANRQIEADAFPYSNYKFFYIAGCTSDGVPFGVTWEEMELKPYEKKPEESDIVDSLDQWQEVTAPECGDEPEVLNFVVTAIGAWLSYLCPEK